MALLKGKLFAGALFAGALLSGQQLEPIPQPEEARYAKGGGAWQPVSRKKILKVIQGEVVTELAILADAPVLEPVSALPISTRKQRARAARRTSEEFLLLS